jgi:hypothetical protein
MTKIFERQSYGDNLSNTIAVIRKIQLRKTTK